MWCLMMSCVIKQSFLVYVLLLPLTFMFSGEMNWQLLYVFGDIRHILISTRNKALWAMSPTVSSSILACCRQGPQAFHRKWLRLWQGHHDQLRQHHIHQLPGVKHCGALPARGQPWAVWGPQATEGDLGDWHWNVSQIDFIFSFWYSTN